MQQGTDGATALPTEGSRAYDRPPRDERYCNLSREELVALLERRDREGARIGLNWAADRAERDRALNDEFVALRLAPEISDQQAPWRNLVIEGDNFDALRWLRMTMRGRVKCIFVDPPYNTGKQDWAYNDGYRDPSDTFHDTTWLEFLHRRFRLARDLLTDDGVIFVCINDEKRALLEMMLDQTLPGMKVGSLVWRTRTGGNEGGQAFLSGNHEHILIYAEKGFKFGGTDKSLSIYKNPDNDPRGRWTSGDLTINVSHKDRRAGKAYYPIHDPEADIYYPCNPDAVWRYASRALSGNNARIKTKFIEDWIAAKQIVFPKEQRVETYSSWEALNEAIGSENVPKSGQSPLLRPGLPDLGFWVGKRIGFGTPRFKRFLKDLKTTTQPLSSWLTPKTEKSTIPKDGDVTLVVGTNDEGAKAIKSLFGAKVFNYTKPVSLLTEIIRQSTGINDVILDFFAGSGTTAQAVMELNAEDSLARRFVMVSHDEATEDQPERNLTRDVLAERLRRLNARVVVGDNGEPAPFAYFRTALIPADRLLDGQVLRAPADSEPSFGQLSPEDVWFAVQAAHDLPLRPHDPLQPLQIAEEETVAVIFLDEVTDAALSRLREAAERRKSIHAYTWTPGPLRRALDGVDAEIHRLPDALWRAFKS